MMQQPLRMIFFASLVFFSGGCGQPLAESEPEDNSERSDERRLSVFAVNYPLAFFAEYLGAGEIDVGLPIAASADPAYWQPTADEVIGYQQADFIEVWSPPRWTMHLNNLMMLLAVFLIGAKDAKSSAKHFIRHPMLAAVKVWALAHLLANGDVASVMLFGAFLAWGVFDLIAVKRTNRGAVVENPRVLFDALAVVAGLAIYTLIVLFAHPYLAGVALSG